MFLIRFKIADYVGRVKAKLVVAHSSNVGNVIEALGTSTTIVVVGDKVPEGWNLCKHLVTYLGQNLVPYEQMFVDAADAPIGMLHHIRENMKPEDVAVYASTGGSTAGPKV